MSSELLLDDDDHGTCISLDMKVGGTAHLCIFDKDDTLVHFVLTPNDRGLKLAEQIEGALKAWRDQVAHLRSCGVPGTSA